jgi:hypothetical protein
MEARHVVAELQVPSVPAMTVPAPPLAVHLVQELLVKDIERPAARLRRHSRREKEEDDVTSQEKKTKTKTTTKILCHHRPPNEQTTNHRRPREPNISK